VNLTEREIQEYRRFNHDWQWFLCRGLWAGKLATAKTSEERKAVLAKALTQWLDRHEELPVQIGEWPDLREGN